MPKQINNLFIRISTFFQIFIFILLLPVSVYSQSVSNLDIFNKLIDSTATQINKVLPSSSKEIYLQLSLGKEYSIFENRIIADLQSSGRNISIFIDSVSQHRTILNIVVYDASVNYGDMFRRSLFGSFYVPRIISIKGNFGIYSSRTVVHKFFFSSVDTVKVSEVSSLENLSFPFTHDKLPPEPFFSSFYEPLIAIGTAAVTIYLFFKVRSK